MVSQRREIEDVRLAIEEALRRVRATLQEPGAFGLLPAIADVLAQMLANLESDLEARDRIAAGLGRLVTDDYSFSESDLGQELLRLSDEFALL